MSIVALEHEVSPIILAHVLAPVGVDRARVQLEEAVIVAVDQADVHGHAVVALVDDLFGADLL